MKIMIAALALAFLVGCSTTYTSGNYIITGEARPATLPESVKVYSVAPANSQQIGLVRGFVMVPDQKGLAACVIELKKQAAKIGANGIIIDPLTGSKPNKLSGVAILVP